MRLFDWTARVDILDKRPQVKKVSGVVFRKDIVKKFQDPWIVAAIRVPNAVLLRTQLRLPSMPSS